MFTISMFENTLKIIINKNDIKSTINVNEIFDDLKPSGGQIYWDKGVFKDHFESLNLKEEEGYISWQLGHFANCFNVLSKTNKNGSYDISRFLLKNIVFNRAIPTYSVVNKYDDTNKYDLEHIVTFPNLSKIEKEYKQYSKSHNETSTTYKCVDEIDMYVACLLHFTTRGYILKCCRNCRKYFFEKDVKVKFCNREMYKNDGTPTTCQKQYNSNKEIKRVKDDPAVLYEKKLRTRYGARNNGDLAKYDEIQKEAKKTLPYSEYVKKLKNWFEKDPLPIKNKGGNN